MKKTQIEYCGTPKIRKYTPNPEEQVIKTDFIDECFAPKPQDKDIIRFRWACVAVFILMIIALLISKYYQGGIR